MIGMTRPVIDLGTDRVLALLEALGAPHKALKNIIHVTGTNGKGSTCEMIAYGLSGLGVRLGIFTSPFLVDETDSIRTFDSVGNQRVISEIQESHFAKIRERISMTNEKKALGITDFESLFCAACVYFHDQAVDTIIVEVGLGGLRDATNVFHNQRTLCVLTGVSLDHQKFLGNTVEEICREKCGIVQEGSTLVVNGSIPCMEVVKRAFKQRGGEDLIVIDPKECSHLSPPLNGDHQLVLTGIALRVINFIRSSDVCMQFVMDTKLPGRLERRRDIPRVRFPVILDGAHNEESAVALRQFADREACGRSLVWIIATSAGRESVVIPNLVRPEDSAIFIKFKSPDSASWIQCASPHELAAISSTMAFQTIDGFVDEAIASIGDIDDTTQLVVVAGSLYLVRNYLRFIGSGVV